MVPRCHFVLDSLISTLESEFHIVRSNVQWVMNCIQWRIGQVIWCCWSYYRAVTDDVGDSKRADDRTTTTMLVTSSEWPIVRSCVVGPFGVDRVTRQWGHLGGRRQMYSRPSSGVATQEVTFVGMRPNFVACGRPFSLPMCYSVDIYP